MLVDNGADLHYHDERGDSLVHLAAAGGNTALLLQLDKRGLPLDEKNHDGSAPAAWAIINNKPDALKALLDYGASATGSMEATKITEEPAGGGQTVLHHEEANTHLLQALIDGNLDIAKMLVDAKPPADVNALVNGEPIAMRLLGQTDDKDLQTRAFDFLRAQKDFRIDTTNEAGETMMFAAARSGNIPLIERLHSLGLDVDATNKEGASPMGEALQKSEVVAKLMDMGASADKPLGFEPPSSQENYLYSALFGGNMSTAQVMLDHHANITASIHGEPLPIEIAQNAVANTKRMP